MRIKKALKISGVVALIVIGLAALLAAQALSDPFRFLPSPQHDLKSTHASLEPLLGRPMEHVTLKDGRLGDIGFVLSLPEAAPAGKLPLLIVLGGLGAGENNIRYMDYAGNNAIIGYDWPMPVRFPEDRDFFVQAPGLYLRVMTIPGQIVSMIEWLLQQPWADANRISLIGLSFGAEAVPAAQAMAESEGLHIGWTIIAYGGAPFGQLFLNNSGMKPVWLRQATSRAIDFLFAPMEPVRYLPQLNGRFLVLEGDDDRIVPEAARVRLREEVPEPKTVVVFPGNHIGVGPQSLMLLKRIMDVSKNWLIGEGAANP